MHVDPTRAFGALTLLVGRQEGHPACKKNCMVRCWCGYLLSGAMCRLAYGPGIWPLKKLNGEVLVWLSVWSKVQT